MNSNRATPRWISRRQFLTVLALGAASVAVAGCERAIDGLSSVLGAQPDTAAGWQKSASNPVLGGKLGTCFDVCVLRDNGLFRMWFSRRSNNTIALVESTDGVAWSKPVAALRPNRYTDWEEKVNRPLVIKRDSLYHLWYTGQARDQSWIGYAISQDGITFERQSANPVLSPELPWEGVAVMCPDVMYDPTSTLYRMWYSAGEQIEPNAIGYATSPDGLNWQKHPANPIFVPGPAGAWDQQRVTACHVAPYEDGYVMFYIGFSDTARIGLARSKDGISGWQRHPDNPIIRPSPGAWDGDAVYKPFALYESPNWLLWYNGRRENFEQIGLALHPGEDLGF